MHTELRGIWEHMLGLGLGALAHANWHAHYFSHENRHWPSLSVLQAAHAAELIIKARIAQEHPLLIFEQLPRSSHVDGNRLDLKALFERGRTIQFSDLPERLWSATGCQIKNVSLYNAFGRLRNCIQHFASPGAGSEDASEFIYGVIDPFIHEHWGLFAIDYNEDTEPHTYLVEGLIRHEVLFLVSTEAAEVEVAFDRCSDEYRQEMEQRFQLARKKAREERPA